MPTNDILHLEVTDFTDADHWRWVLKEPNGVFLADYQVALEQADSEYEAFVGLYDYVERHVAPDRWMEDEGRMVEAVGAWMGEKVLGPVGEKLLAYGTPVTVRVILPTEASGLLYRPLELAHVRGVPLAQQDVSLVLEIAGEAPPVRRKPVGERLRMLAVFSLPTDASVLSLRRERYALKRLIHRIAQTHRKAIELRVIQYGVTRDALREVLEEGDGWDVMHFSGHGVTASLALEKPDGTIDLITSDELEKLLRPARGRLKLVTLSACLSAAATAAETLSWLGVQLPEPRRTREAASEVTAEVPIPAVAHALVRELDCAALAMRYPVGDDFAIDLAAELYEGMLGKGQPLPRALQLAIAEALRDGYHPGAPPLSVATPALFGRRAVDLALGPPLSPVTDFSTPAAGLAYFPPEPERFVGRVGPMSRASAAMAPESGVTGVLFHGMAGAGKTACALELAYRYEAGGRFAAFVWHKAPDEGSDIETALVNLALDMERQLPGLQMVHLVDRADEFAAWLPRLTELLEQHSILIVLDNLESLLTLAGGWRDERWGRLVDALLAHNGLSRLVLTSRRLPTTLQNDHRLRSEPIHALSRDEAALLARELPNLGRLLRGKAGIGLAEGRELVLRTLAVVQGHPKLIELAEGQAHDPAALAAHLERAEKAWSGDEDKLGAFFSEGESRVDAAEFLTALTAWTQGISATLPAPARTLFHFLCALEEGDRQSWIVEANWSDLWVRLGHPGEPPDLSKTLQPLTAMGLVEAQPHTQSTIQNPQWVYTIHPSVADAGKAEAGEAFQTAVDAELAVFWVDDYQHGRENEMRGGGARVVQAGRRAAPYLLRREIWGTAAKLLEQVIIRDRSPRTVAVVLPLLRRIADETEGTKEGLENAGKLAIALLNAGRWREAEAMGRDLARRAAEQGVFRLALVETGVVINILLATGRAEEGLKLVEEMKGYTRRAGLGTWTQLSDEGMRLQLLNALGRYEEVLTAVETLRAQMAKLPEESEGEEAAEPWNVRELILDTGQAAAVRLERLEMALALNDEILDSQKARRAPSLEVARMRFNNYFPLLRLKRYDEARALLFACRDVFEVEQDIENLGKVFSALADLEDKLGHREPAIAFEKNALRYMYRAGDPDDCAISHNNLSNYLVRAGEDRRTYLTHYLAAGVISFQTSSGFLATPLRNLTIDFKQFAPEPPPLPESFDELCRIVEAVEGVRFRELFARLPQRAATGDEAMRVVLALVAEMLRGGAVK